MSAEINPRPSMAALFNSFALIREREDQPAAIRDRTLQFSTTQL
jgi:hypothetical protein